MAKRKIIDVRRGGVLIPIGNNTYLAKGRTHEQGGIDIGDDLEIENNEVAQLKGDYLKIFSAQPILNGYSPSQLVLGGANPDRVFNAQERFKKVNKLNDDGTRKKRIGGIEQNDSTRRTNDIPIFNNDDSGNRIISLEAGNIAPDIRLVKIKRKNNNNSVEIRANTNRNYSNDRNRDIINTANFYRINYIINNAFDKMINGKPLEAIGDTYYHLKNNSKRSLDYSSIPDTIEDIISYPFFIDTNRKETWYDKLLKSGDELLNAKDKLIDFDNTNKKKYGDRMKYIKNMLRY